MKTLTLTNLTEEELNIIASGLASLPYGRVYTLIDKIQFQVNEQLNPKINLESKLKIEE